MAPACQTQRNQRHADAHCQTDAQYRRQHGKICPPTHLQAPANPYCAFNIGRRASRTACPRWSVGTIVFSHSSLLTLQPGNTRRSVKPGITT
ncbi:DUF1534 domain-containing protein [Pseudomonas coronafaciens pv. oryzae str. 1_6]|nr:DUF1534 domain-containing protein [Pseudomonas coronafaciens pv. oryzae str. 1_6]